MADRILLVGINAYQRAPLYGCINDVTDMAAFLVKQFGVDPGGIRLLTDHRATTAAILERLNWLADAQPGDRCYFHFSGHGTQVATRDRQHEVDGLDEVICPIDFDWSDAHMIRDKQFHQIFSRIPSTVKFTWVSDSCHSGDLTRDLNILRCMPIPADIAWRNEVAIQKGFTLTPISKSATINLNVGYISGCKTEQTSADARFNGRYNGALTYYLIRELEKAPTISLKEIVQNVDHRLVGDGYSQRPQAEGSRINQPFLG